MDLIKNLQNKPEKERKKILWVVLSVIALFFIVLWFIILANKLGEMKKIKIEEVIVVPKIESPPKEIEGDLKEFEEIFKNLENEQRDSTN